jgi:hypothetical protein
MEFRVEKDSPGEVKVPGSHELAMALVFLFVAWMGAKMLITGLAGQRRRRLWRHFTTRDWFRLVSSWL